jgi:hypothetical protein
LTTSRAALRCYTCHAPTAATAATRAPPLQLQVAHRRCQRQRNMAEPWQNQAQKQAPDGESSPDGAAAEPSARQQAASSFIAHRSAIGATDPPVWITNDEHAQERLVYVASGALHVCTQPGESDSVVTPLDLELGSVGFLPGTGLQLSASPDGASVAWVTDELYVLPVAGPTAEIASRTVHRVTTLGCRIESYSWSPDCSQLVLSANRLGHFQIWVVDVADGSARRVTSETSGTVDINPSFTHDGAAVVFARLDASWTAHTILMLPLTAAADDDDGPSPIIIAEDTDNFNYMKTAHFALKASPASGLACFRSQRSGHTNLWLVRLEPGAQPFPLCPEEAEQGAETTSPRFFSSFFLVHLGSHCFSSEQNQSERFSQALRSGRPMAGALCTPPTPTAHTPSLLPTSRCTLETQRRRMGQAAVLARLSGTRSFHCSAPLSIHHRAASGCARPSTGVGKRPFAHAFR